MRKCYTNFMLLAFLLVGMRSFSQEISQLSFYSPLISTFDMKYTNNHLIVSQNGLLIFDVTDPTKKPKLVSQTSFPGSIANVVEVQGSYAYMALGNKGIFAVYDIANFNAPVLKGSLSIPATTFYGIGDIASHGNYAYLTGFDSLYVVNVSDPSSPLLANALPVAHTQFTGAEDIAIEGNSLFIKTSFFIEVYDITNPASPSLISTINYLHFYNQKLAVDTINHRLFLSWATALKDFTGYDAYDVANPSEIKYLFSDSSTFSSGDFGIMDYSYHDTVLFISRGGSVSAFDVSATPHLVTTFTGEDIPNATVSIQVRDSVLFHARGGGIEVLKYSKTPVVVDVCNEPENLKEKITGTTAYLKWNRVKDVKGYIVAYRKLGTHNWKAIPTKDNTQVINNLIPGKGYTWQVKSVCDNKPLKISDWSLYNIFFVGNSAINPIITFAPNPVKDVMRVQIKDASITQIIITDLTGKPLIKAVRQGQEQNIYVSKLHTGTYILQALDKSNAVVGAAKIYKE